ncbi:acetyl-CoA carboxylase biotin carboxyl carrier protein [Singulisphaera acidiphila]|uniref:Biotin carboxyl carrier protein of acetyl-CoA carboxylase n=1 Tax=Singulisphaera acidiphila (strain ATCC BAA-1392 / DSM 18658 / VKM B-2454 / MOB10) TaxID=886293 RepID=L0DH63_SINAD|nr:acetyl-CoA carboxylase biotin carboxyl carrier protein [Singulisphaera acidiphila]AGA28006.1 acetyl-CoA carboxylase, biotin carboxyl carrier protein [Singulisphaera acidiphila DSM 18658]
MPEKPTEPTPPFDVHVIHQLVRLMKRYDLMAIDLVEGPTKIRLRRRNETPAPAPAVPGLYAAPPPPVAAPARIDSIPTAPPVSDDAVIKSPMVGTYYASSSPDAPPFVTVGATIRPDSTVCVIEAMKVFTDIPAGLSGKITEVLVKNGQSVEFGQPMFRVQPA